MADIAYAESFTTGSVFDHPWTHREAATSKRRPRLAPIFPNNFPEEFAPDFSYAFKQAFEKTCSDEWGKLPRNLFFKALKSNTVAAFLNCFQRLFDARNFDPFDDFDWCRQSADQHHFYMTVEARDVHEILKDGFLPAEDRGANDRSRTETLQPFGRKFFNPRIQPFLGGTGEKPNQLEITCGFQAFVEGSFHSFSIYALGARVPSPTPLPRLKRWDD